MDSNGIEILPARRGHSLRWQGRTLLSRVDPVTQAERLTASAPVQPRTLYLSPRPLFGYGLAAFAETLDGDSAIVGVETDQALFEWTRRHIDPALRARGRFTLLYGENAARACAEIRALFPPRRFRRITPLPTSAAWQSDASFFNSLLALLDNETATEWSNAMTLTRLGRLYARNFFRNLPLLATCPSLSALDFGSAPVLVAGAGPSLNLAIERLLKAGVLQKGAAPDVPPSREAAGKSRAAARAAASSAPPQTAFEWLAAGGQKAAGGALPARVVAADTALPALLEQGVQPSLVVALEAQHWNRDDFTGLYGKDLPLAMDCSALPQTARIFARPPYLFWTEWTPLRLFERLAARGALPFRMPPLGSVGLYACAIARHLTRGTVIRAGLDFSFNASLYHCRASPSHKKLLREATRLKSVYPLASVYRPGSFARAAEEGGAAVRSDPALEQYRKLFERGLPPLEGTRPAAAPDAPVAAELVAALIQDERERLLALRAILTDGGESPRLERLLDDCDYLWAHFPECAGKGGWRPAVNDYAFLKRVRVEIDPFLRLLF